MFKKDFNKNLIKVLIFVFYSSFLYAQNTDFLQLNDTLSVNEDEKVSSAPTIMKKKWNHYENKFASLNIGLAFIYDYNLADQDHENIQQVGKIGHDSEFRGERFIFTGTFFASKKNPWRYMVSANFNGLDAPEGKKTFDFVDWNLEIPISKTGGWFTLGKQKEGVGLEYVSPGTQLQFTERATATPAFVRQRNIGVRYSNSILKNKMTYTVGFFNNYWETGNSFSNNGSQIITRVTGLPIYKSDRELLHLGAGYRYSDAVNGKLSYKGKPEMNTAPVFVNTGSFQASSSNLLMLELIGVKGPFSLIAEYMNNTIDGTINNKNANFNSWQIGGSWFITGENRRYNKNTGNLGKLIPKSNFKFNKHTGPGAFELGARFTHTDFVDETIYGGLFNRFSTALSWYSNAHFRYEINYGRGSLDKNQLIGNVDFWQFRVQFEL